MNKERLRKHVADYLAHLKATPEKYATELQERTDRSAYYRSWTAARLAKMTKDDVTEYFSKLWAMRIWGNKQYVVDQLIADNTLLSLAQHLADLVWSSAPLEKRWDHFRKHIKGVGPAMMSEILCHVHPDTCMLWNRRAYVGLNYLGIADLPRHNYQLTGKVYALCAPMRKTIPITPDRPGDAQVGAQIYQLWVGVSEFVGQPHKRPCPNHAVQFLSGYLRFLITHKD